MSEERQLTRLTRRQFGGVIAAAAALPFGSAPFDSAQGRPQQGQPDGTPPPQRRLVPEDPPFGTQLEFGLNPTAPRAVPFPMTQVRLLPDSVYHDAQEWNRGYMSRLAADRLLYTFRANAGLQTGSAKPLGGWEQPENGQRSSELRGHFIGHFLSASALLYASTGDAAAKSKADDMVAELARCQQKLGGTYLSAFPITWFDRLDRSERVWAPFYTIHKIMAGMWDMYRLAGNKEALRVLEGMAGCAEERSAA